ncbi:MAG: hypothetical protein ABFC84_02505 [Veillonellales bacterium]
MSYNSKLPADDEYIAAGPADIRENLRALKEDQIVNAGTLSGLPAGNASGNIPESNGTVNANLNADRLDGYDASAFAMANHAHSAATTSTPGFMSAVDKTKLDGIAAGAQVNQNAFSNVLAGSTTIQADSQTDTLEIVGGANISVVADATNDRLTFAVNGKVASASTADAATTAGTATYANIINCPDGDRLASTKLPTTTPKAVRFDFVAASSTGTGGDYAGVMTYAPWDGTYDAYTGGDCSYQLAFGSTIQNGGAPQLRIRNGIGSSWNAWKDIITSDTIGSQAVNYAASAGSAPANGGNAATVGGYAPQNTGSGASWPFIPFVQTSGVIEIGKYIDFHESSNDGLDYAARITSVNGTLQMPDMTISGKQVATTDQIPQTTYITASGSGTNYYWRKWSNGDIEQYGWNLGPIGQDSTQHVAFPVQFQSQVFYVGVIQTSNFRGDGQGEDGAGNWSLSGFDYTHYSDGGNTHYAYHAVGR